MMDESMEFAIYEVRSFLDPREDIRATALLVGCGAFMAS
jgi:hypothetical protein